MFGSKHGEKRTDWNENVIKIYCEQCREWIKYELDFDNTNHCKECGEKF